MAGEAKPHAEAVTAMQIHTSPCVTAKGVAGKGNAAYFQHSSLTQCTQPARRQTLT